MLTTVILSLSPSSSLLLALSLCSPLDVIGSLQLKGPERRGRGAGGVSGTSREYQIFPSDARRNWFRTPISLPLLNPHPHPFLTLQPFLPSRLNFCLPLATTSSFNPNPDSFPDLLPTPYLSPLAPPHLLIFIPISLISTPIFTSFPHTHPITPSLCSLPSHILTPPPPDQHRTELRVKSNPRSFKSQQIKKKISLWGFITSSTRDVLCHYRA